MNLRLIPAALLFAASSALAQGDVPVKPVPAKPDPTAQTPAPVVQEKSSGTIIAELEREKERLQREIEYARNRAKNANKMLAEKLGQRVQTIPAIDAGTNQPVQPVAVEMTKARLFEEAERAKFDKSVMLVVNGLPIQQTEFDAMMAYKKSLSNSGDDSSRAQTVLFELIRVYSVAAAFPENDAEGQVSEVVSRLQQGATIADVAKTFGTILGAQQDGSVTVTRNSFLGTTLEQTAFALKEGEYSRPIRTVFGFAIVGVDKIEKGATPELDKLTAHAVQIRYAADEATLAAAQSAASRGQVEILVRDQAVLDMLPPMYRPVAAMPAPEMDQRVMLTRQLEAVDAQIKGLESGQLESPDAKAQLEALRQQSASLKAAIAKLPNTAGDLGSDAAVPEIKVAPIKQDAAPVPVKKT